MPLPGAVFSSRVPVGLWLVMPVAKVDAALAVEVISWRMGVCVTMAVEAGAGAAAAAGTGRVCWIGAASKTHAQKRDISEYKQIKKAAQTIHGISQAGFTFLQASNKPDEGNSK